MAGSTIDVNRWLAACAQDSELLETTLAVLPDQERGWLLSIVGVLVLQEFERTRSVDKLVQAITIEERAVACTPLGNPHRAMCLNSLGFALQKRFEWTELMNDMDRSIAFFEEAFACAPDDHSDRADYLSNLSCALRMRYDVTGVLDDLNRAMVSIEQVLASTPDIHPKRPSYLHTFVIILLRRFERTGLSDEIDRAISIAEQAVVSLPDEHPHRIEMLDTLGTVLMSRYEQTGSKQDLSRAVRMVEQAVTSATDEHARRYLFYNNLGNALQMRYEQTRSLDDLDRAITMIEGGMASIPGGHPDRPLLLNNLGGALQRHFGEKGSMTDIDKAIRVNDEAVSSTSNEHPRRGMYLNNLGNALNLRFEKTRSMNDLDRAIKTLERAVDSSPASHPIRTGILSNLGIALQQRFEQTGSISNLDRAIAVYKDTVTSTPYSHVDLPGYLNNFANALQRRFEWKGSMEDLEQAVAAYQQAIVATPALGPNRQIYLNGFGSMMLSRFEWTRSTNDQDQAITIATEATNGHPGSHSVLLNNLGNALVRRAERRGLEDLNEAIGKYEQAISSGGRNDWRGRSGRLNNLAGALRRRFDLTNSLDDLDRAITLYEEAIDSVPTEHPKRGMYLHNMASGLQTRFEQTGSIEALTQAIETSKQAIEATADDNFHRANRLNSLGKALEIRFERVGSVEDLDCAIIRYEQVVAIEIASPSIRLKAARACSDLLIRERKYSRAKPLLQTAVNLLPTISPRELKRSDQQLNISLWANIPSRAVSLCLAEGEDPYKSLQLLELGRGVIANLQLEIRSDITVLETLHPDLAQQFEELRDQIDRHQNPVEPVTEDVLSNRPMFDLISTSNGSTSISKQRALCKQFSNLLHYIRTLDGFENFLKGPSEAELQSLAEGGSIVVFNVSEIRSDAFLITTDNIRVVHLPSLTSESLQTYTQRFVNAIDSQHHLRTYNHARFEMNAILEWLWDAGVQSILDTLGYNQTPRHDDWPRVRWVASGLLNVLPIHASGYHALTPPKTALDYVISSYAHTIKSLWYARDRAVKADQVTSQDSAILIAMPTTPGNSPLPSVAKECNELQNLFRGAKIGTEIREHPTREAVIGELPKYNIVHFACHGYSATDPSQSGLLLEDWKSLPLTVLDLISVKSEQAKFAYLSACHTSAMRDKNLMDEAINLSSAVQLAGFPSVVGTLWRVMDNYSPNIARNVYKWSLEGSGRFDAGRIAEGLHKAVRDLRYVTGKISRSGSDPLIWAPYVYVGI